MSAAFFGVATVPASIFVFIVIRAFADWSSGIYPVHGALNDQRISTS